ncbi:uncharacterized protein TNCV_4217631 [Trichonephila clavipes]|nr:uncharacterized protein TNCV_4217631 [Trichonephila clavipes]
MSSKRSEILELFYQGKRDSVCCNLPFQRACNDGQRAGSGRKLTVNFSRSHKAFEKRVQKNPRVSMKQIAYDMGISDILVKRIVKTELGL